MDRLLDYNPFSLKDKTILVTGASSGIGRATAIECSKMGATVVITGRNSERLNETYNALVGENHVRIIADLSKIEDIDSIAKKVPSLDGCVNNAGTTKILLTPFLNQEDLIDVFQVNTFAPMMLTQRLLKNKKMKKKSSIVFVSSISGNNIVVIGRSIYAASKCALTGFMKNSAIDLASKGIRCNCVVPGMVETDLMKSAIFDEEHRDEDEKSYPLRRYGKPEEIAYGIVYLLSDASVWVTGSSLLIDGGKSL